MIRKARWRDSPRNARQSWPNSFARRNPPRHAERISSEPEYIKVIEHDVQNLRLRSEDVAEFDSKPTACTATYRQVVVRKNITVALRSERGRLTFELADSGPGLPDAVRGRLFTPFFSTKRDGRGLGLTVVREILVQHRFEFDLDNAEDGGALFRLRC